MSETFIIVDYLLSTIQSVNIIDAKIEVFSNAFASLMCEVRGFLLDENREKFLTVAFNLPIRKFWIVYFLTLNIAITETTRS